MYLSTNLIIKNLIYFIPIFLVFSIFLAELFILFVVIIFFSYQIKNKEYKIFLNKYFIFFFIFWCFLLINSIFSYDPSLSFSKSLPYIRFGILFLAIRYMLNFEDFKNKFLKYIFIFLIFVCIDAIIQFFFGRNLVGFEAHISRISSFFKDELVLGGFLLKMYPLFLISIIYLKKKFSLNYFLITILILIYFFSIFLSGERTAFFNFIILNFILFIILYESRYSKYLLLFLLVIPLIFIYIKSANYQIAARYLSIKEIFNNKTPIIFSKTHENHYKSAFKIFKSYPVFGSGLKTFRHVCKKPEHNPNGCTTHPHNIFMQFLSELGIIGILFYLYAFFYFGSRLFKLFLNRFNNNNLRNETTILTIIIASMFMSLWPLSPSGNFFNNWMSILNFLPLSFLIYFDKQNSN